MIPYLLLITLAALLAFTGARHPKIPLVLLALLYWMFIGLRLHVGADWNSYVDIYERTRSVPLLKLLFNTEPGFKLLIWIANATGGGLILVNAVSALVFCFGFFVFAARCREPFIAVLVATPLVVVAFAMSGIRQAMALGVIFYLYATWDSRGARGRIALVLVAASFHFSAVFVLIFVALSARVTFVVKLAAVAADLLLIGLVIYYAPSAFDAYSKLYLGGRGTGVEAPGAIAHVAVLAAAALVYLLFRKRWVEVNGDNRLHHNLAIASLLAIPAVVYSSLGAYRFALYLWPFAMYVWSGVPAMVERATGRALYRIVVATAACGLLVGWLTFANTSVYWIPYKNWWLEPAGFPLVRHKAV